MTIQSGTDQSTRIPETADYKMLYQQLKMKHQFMLSQVSHEIRNPVTLINSFMQLLEGRHPELMQDNYWQKIMENMDFLKSLLIIRLQQLRKTESAEFQHIYYILRSN